MMDSTIFNTLIFSIFFLFTIVFIEIYLLRRNKFLLNEKDNKIIELNEELLKEKKQLEKANKEKNLLFDPYSDENKNQSIFLGISVDGTLLSLNDYAVNFFGYNSQDELIGKDVIGTLVPARDSMGQNMSDLLEKIKNNPRLYVDTENENICKDGKRVWISWTNRIIYENGVPKQIHAIGFDITPRKQLEDNLRKMTMIDPVTGVLNRKKFLEEGAREMKRAVRYDRELSVLLLTIDKFDSLNQDLGIAFSNKVIQVAVTACRNSTRDSDYIGRIGDIEFALILPETPLNGAKIVAERIRNDIMKTNLSIDDENISVTTSISIASRIKDENSIDLLIMRAFSALKENKDRQNNIAIA